MVAAENQIRLELDYALGRTPYTVGASIGEPRTLAFTLEAQTKKSIADIGISAPSAKLI